MSTTYPPIVVQGTINVGPNPLQQTISFAPPGAPVRQQKYVPDNLAPGYSPTSGDTVEIIFHLEPAERIVLETIGKPGTLAVPEARKPKPVSAPALGKVTGPPPEDLPDGVYYPQVDPLYRMPAQLKKFTNYLAMLQRDGVRVNGLITGKYGAGKTTWAEQYAALFAHPFCKIDIGTLVQPDEMLGFRNLTPTGTELVIALLLRAMQVPHCIILADELNRTSTANTNALLPLLDHTGRVWLEYLQQYVVVHPTVQFFGTANMDPRDNGTHTINGALMRRLKFPIEVDYPTPDEETEVVASKCRIDKKLAGALVAFAVEIRGLAEPTQPEPLEVSIGTSTLLDIGDLVRVGMSAGDALRFALLPRFPKDGDSGGQRDIVAKLLQGKFGD
jgi:nitric oxide reductase NorQ protein